MLVGLGTSIIRVLHGQFRMQIEQIGRFSLSGRNRGKQMFYLGKP